MRSVQDQLAAVLAAVGPVAPLEVVLADAVGCILAVDVVAAHDLPPFALAAQDGYAVASADTAAAGHGLPLHLPVVHDVHVGAAAPLRLVSGYAVGIASGAPLPRGADAVVPLDQTDRGTARVLVPRPTVPGEHVRREGVDARGGDVVLAAGTRLGPRQVALAAALGRGRVTVHPSPRVVVLSIGDELTAPGAAPLDGMVHDANGPALVSAVGDTGAHAIRIGVVGDDRAALREVIQDQLVRADLLITTGGLSESASDTVKDVLASLGTVRFDHVAMTPGRLQGYGRVGGDDHHPGVPIFALPGHPVAAYISYEVFVRPVLRAISGRAELFRSSVPAVATAGWPSPAGQRQFVPAILAGSPDGGYRVTPLGEPGELSVVALSRANALAVVPERDVAVQAGDRVHCLVLEG
ncbi:molybdopterin molybdotransferase MoeA [Pengzhenrongella frigida]|uniref:Molybdopterin molybdenumtransferase n=1 Tax=Pengzhenrongella frigida TaxID=1259133 RepID=A0A4Q5MXP5_9MICO|nr:gephyrin-like molybdotransferase Glp [Cellulomonas sp. HLT2-17]RYV50386.1 molybdopterin molybdenumtransferase MoeA [Cellulomonas sp. HLT2-17]